MDIRDINVDMCLKGAFEKVKNEGVRHKKELPCLSFVEVTEGSYEIGIDGESPKCADGFFIAPAYKMQEIVHHVDKTTHTMSARWVFLDITINHTHSFDSVFSYPTIPCEDLKKELEIIFKELFATDNIIENKISCYKLIKAIFPYITEKTDINEHISKAIGFIRENFQKQIQVSDIAGFSGISESRLYTLFKKEYKTTPIAYLNMLRILHACFLLENTNMPIREIADSCGISDAYYFSRLFKSRCSISPTEYRRINKIR